MANRLPCAVRTEVPARRAEVAESIPVLRPRLPSTDRLVAYSAEFDASRLYTNHGPLSTELENRLAHHPMLPPLGVTCASSGRQLLSPAPSWRRRAMPLNRGRWLYFPHSPS